MRPTLLVLIAMAFGTRSMRAQEFLIHEDQVLQDPQAPPGSGIGFALALEDPWLAVGEPGADSVAMYRHDGIRWRLVQRIVHPAPGDFFGNSLSLSGDRLLVGAVWGDGANPSAGAAHVFRFDGTSWVFEQKLTDPGGESGDQFGTQVVLEGNRAAITAFQDRPSPSIIGSVSTFTFDGVQWNRERKFQKLDVVYASSISLDASTLLIHSAVRTRVFDHNGTKWIHSPRIRRSEGGRSGMSALEGDFCILAPRDRLVVDRKVAGVWTSVQELMPAHGGRYSRLVLEDGVLVAAESVRGQVSCPIWRLRGNQFVPVARFVPSPGHALQTCTTDGHWLATDSWRDERVLVARIPN